MGVHVIRVPDLGEGIAEVELVVWHVAAGDTIVEDQGLADVMTDKASVEIPSPVAGKVLALGGEVGQMLAVGSELIRIEVEDAAGTTTTKTKPMAAPTPVPPSPPARDARTGRGFATNARVGAPVGGGTAIVDAAPDRFTRGSRARLGARDRPARRHRHRPCGQDRPGRPRCPRRARRRPHEARSGAARGGNVRRDARRQDRRPAPQDRAEDAGVEAPHPALHLRRGSRRHRDRGVARGAQREVGR
jgi:pyruvate/2-oxoglutarate dehydrogenase complex dihydrolipoamide acyltransferase (E2) component